MASSNNVRVVEAFFRTRSVMSLLSETPLFQLLTQEIREQARQEAQQQARLDTRRADLLRVLARKFGILPENIYEAIQTITVPERLEQLLDAAIDSATLQDFHSHL